LVQDDKIIATAATDFDGQFHLLGVVRSGSFFVRLTHAPEVARRASADWRSWRVQDVALLLPDNPANEARMAADSAPEPLVP
jgi:hypothetical protein